MAARARTAALLAWYRRNRRDLPWRQTTDPYRILVAEMMLQQTGVDRVVPHYLRFLERFPTAADLAAAPLRGVLEEWNGLGYNVRARRLREAARIVTDRGWPDGPERLQELPGVGPYTAAAVASFAFGHRVAAVDTNVRRVVSRWVGEPLTDTELRSRAAALVPAASSEWNQAVMDLAASLCRPRLPSCPACPVERWCSDPTVSPPASRPPRFEGSMRQVRGAVVRHLSSEGASTLDALALATGLDRERLADAIESLRVDRLVEGAGDTLEIGS